MPLPDDICLLMLRELKGFQREVLLFPDDESLWRVVPGISNSAGNLALHVAGNLQHFVGACLGSAPYVRNRTAEFGTRSGTREAVRVELENAMALVSATLPGLDEAALRGPMPGAPNGMTTRTELFLLHLVSHTGFHLGQAGYIRRVVTADPASAGPLPLEPLGEG